MVKMSLVSSWKCIDMDGFAKLEGKLRFLNFPITKCWITSSVGLFFTRWTSSDMHCIFVICILSGWACEGFRFNWIWSSCERWTLCNILTFQWNGAMSGSLYRIILARFWNLSTFFIWAATQSTATILRFLHSLWFLQTLTLTMAMTFICHTWAWKPYK